MSTIYPDLTCNFPNSIDPNKTFSDVTSTTKDLVNQYYTYKEAGNDSAAIDILTQNPDLKNTIITHEVIQLIYDMCIAQQRFYTSDVRNTLTTIVHYKGAFNETTKYSMFDLVTYNYRAYLCNSSDVAVGTLPTASGWDRITFQGESGTGMAFYTAWDNAQAYKVQDCVPYSNKLYVCIQANTNQIPLDNPTYWKVVITAPKQIVISTTQPENQDENDIWYKKNVSNNTFETWEKNNNNSYSRLIPYLTASDVGARPSTWTPTYNEVGAPSLSSHNSLVSQMTSVEASVAQLETNLNGSWRTLLTNTRPPYLSSNTIYYIVNDSGCLAQLARFGSKDISLMPFGVSDIDYLAVCVVYKKCDAMKMGSSYTVEPTYVASDIQDFTGTSYSGIGGSSLSLTSSKVSGTIQGNVYDAKNFFIGFTFELVTNSGVHIPIERDRYNWNGWMDSLYKLVNGITSLKISGVFTREYYVWTTAHMLSNTISFPNNSNSVTENFEISSIPTGAGLSSYYGVCPSVSNSSSVTVGINFSCSINGRSITCKVEDHISH